jgi:hypothetical protein
MNVHQDFISLNKDNHHVSLVQWGHRIHYMVNHSVSAVNLVDTVIYQQVPLIVILVFQVSINHHQVLHHVWTVRQPHIKIYSLNHSVVCVQWVDPVI